MKILKAFTIICSLISFAASAQEISNNAIGLRIGDSDGFGAEISYQRKLQRTNRLEVDLGWYDSRNYNAFKSVGLYQWVLPIDGGFNWYFGPGAGLGIVDFSPVPGDNYDDVYYPDGGLFILAAGDIGIEYNFKIPLLISLDFRPESDSSAIKIFPIALILISGLVYVTSSNYCLPIKSENCIISFVEL